MVLVSMMMKGRPASYTERKKKREKGEHISAKKPKKNDLQQRPPQRAALTVKQIPCICSEL